MFARVISDYNFISTEVIWVELTHQPTGVAHCMSTSLRGVMLCYTLLHTATHCYTLLPLCYHCATTATVVSGGPVISQEQLAELEEETERLRTGNAQLESSLDASEKVCVQLRTDKEKASEAMAQLTLQLEEGQARAEEEKQKMTQLEEENHQLQDETQQLRDETQQLRDETKQLQDEVERLHCAASTPAVPEQQTANPDAAASTDTEAFQAQLIVSPHPLIPSHPHFFLAPRSFRQSLRS